MTQLNDAMNEIAELNKKGGTGTVNLKGKTYTNVSARVEVFRKHLGTGFGIETAPLFPAQGGLFMQAWVKDKDGFILGTGHAYTQNVSKDKGVEKLESVAIGRAMASIGLAGGEYASDGEMESWQERYDNPPKIHMEMGADDVEPEVWMSAKIENLYDYIKKPRSSVAGLIKGDQKTRSDPIFIKIIDEGLEELRDNYEIAIKDAETKLKEKETA